MFLKLFFYEYQFLLFIFSDIGLLVFSIIDVFFFFGYLLSGLANAGIGEDPFMLCITSPESHIYKWGGFLGQGIINVDKFLEAFSVTSRR